MVITEREAVAAAHDGGMAVLLSELPRSLMVVSMDSLFVLPNADTYLGAPLHF